MKHRTQWSAIIASLGGYSIHAAVVETATRTTLKDPVRTLAKSSCDRSSPVLSIERVDDDAILVSWSDATGGCYLDQNWRAGRSRGSGQCALTRVPIKRGDRVYRPLCRSKIHPSNAGEMILASAVETFEEVPTP